MEASACRRQVKNQRRQTQTRLVVALDTDSLQEAKELVDILYPTAKIFKIGSQLFTQEGPEAVKMVHKKGAEVFLDLKFHDIPNTVAGAVKRAGAMQVFMTNLHASGGAAMMKAAVKVRGKSRTPILLAVTILTSIDKKELRAIGIARTPIAQVQRLALLAKKCGMDGVVCSGREIDAVRKVCGKDFIVLTPGIRAVENAGAQDQKRIMTPVIAAQKGSDYIVVGRPITKAENPLTVAKKILQDIK